MARLIIAGLVLAFAAAGCGPKYPTHNGYKKKQKKPWAKAKEADFDEAGDAEIDGTISWKKRRRARWYAINVSRYSNLSVTLRGEQVGSTEDEFDLAFELISERGKVLIRADKEEDDAGEEEKTRKVAELDRGLYWLHVFAQNRMDAATFNVRIKLEPVTAPDESTFPREVTYVGKLAAVPPVDDTPVAAKPPKCRGKKCKRRVVNKPPPKSNSKKARLISVSARKDGRTSITIGLGKSQGITKGSRGKVVTSSGKSIQGGSFTITRVSATKAWASVRASLDAVNAAKYARVTPAAAPAPSPSP